MQIVANVFSCTFFQGLFEHVFCFLGAIRKSMTVLIMEGKFDVTVHSLALKYHQRRAGTFMCPRSHVRIKE